MSGHVFPPSDTRQLYWQYRRGLISYSQYQDQLEGFNEYYRNYQQQQEECNERTKTLMEIAFCCPCAGLCYEDDSGKKCCCASSMSCMLYGGITTLFSSGAVFDLSPTALGLKVGIPILALGTLCAIGTCTHEKMCEYCVHNDCCECEESSPSNSAPFDVQPGDSTPSAVTSQPGSTRTTNCNSEGSDGDSDSDSERESGEDPDT